MGYTHYWRTPQVINEENWKELTKAVEKLFKGCQDIIQKEYDDSDEPEVSDQRIRFNGIGEDSCETFMLSRKYEGWTTEMVDELLDKEEICRYFNFCKTRERPYDKYVTAVLILAKGYLKEEIRISSDGYVSEWQEGIKLINEKMGWSVKIIPNSDPEKANDITEASFINEDSEVTA